ncbi:MAG: HPF/RaiA family ribosome-associated protein [Algibacter sp.]|uniref:HPF/RaiA family ribosome-associated protein n=1 Tax=Algibacter sp. TaxID=1872428 RepID=UPI00262791FA|nr:HPF/RaiA family ribosome-associated protein [Algibacter sp.]MDG1729496.1 HPF/RaiA family ribosome-associated protein [Algibacter sp.]MDG2178682.1 HPF/RaiA family ribosome-associated protein [Algibacter sp.]
MEYIIQFIQTPIRESSESLVIEKLENLGKKFDWIIRADVFFKEDKGTYGKGKICDIRLSVPGPRIFASSNEESFEAAV